MSRSEPKPKIIYKNLEEVIKSSSLHKKTLSKTNSTKILHPQPLMDLSNSTMKLTKNKQSKEIGAVDMYSNCYNEIDAVFTDLEDHLCQAKERVLEQIRSLLKNRYVDKSEKNLKEKVEDMGKMSEYIKHISNFFVNGEVPLKENFDSEPCYSYSRNKTGNTKNTIFTEIYEDDSDKILALSNKSSKSRVNRRGELISNRKKTVYELILEERENKIKVGASILKKGRE